MILLEGSRIFAMYPRKHWEADDAFWFCQNDGEILFRYGDPSRVVSLGVCNYSYFGDLSHKDTVVSRVVALF